MVQTTLEARQQMLDTLAEATDEIGLALASLGDESIFWRVVATPTNLLVRPLELVPPLERVVIGQLNLAELLAAAVVGLGALFALSSLAIRRQ